MVINSMNICHIYEQKSKAVTVIEKMLHKTRIHIGDKLKVRQTLLKLFVTVENKF